MTKFARVFLLVFLSAITLLSMQSCADSTKKESSLFPIQDFLLGQVASADSSLLPIRMIHFINDSTSDTLFIPREEFRSSAREFLELPDLASREYADRFQESSNFDPDLERLLIHQTPVDPSKELVQRQELIVDPKASGSRIEKVIIQTAFVSKDSSVEKRMIWNTDRSFQVTNIRQRPGNPETISTYRVEWNIQN